MIKINKIKNSTKYKVTTYICFNGSEIFLNWSIFISNKFEILKSLTIEQHKKFKKIGYYKYILKLENNNSLWENMYGDLIDD